MFESCGYVRMWTNLSDECKTACSTPDSLFTYN